jgi:hypothetical protein
MSNVVTFTPQYELDRRKNLNDFITFSNNLDPLNNKYIHKSNHWTGIGNFVNFGLSNQDRNTCNVFHETLLPFAKSYVVYGGGTTSKIRSKFYALRAINAACVKKYGEVNISTLSIDDFNASLDVADESLGTGAAYQAGLGLNHLLKFLIDKKIIEEFTWKSSLSKDTEGSTSDDAAIIRQAKMPDDNALLAIAQISTAKAFNLSPRDIFTTSIMTILMSAPARGSELFYLRSDCLHEEKMTIERVLNLGLDKHEVDFLLGKSKNLGPKDKITLIGIRWYSGKGYGHANKWLPSVMFDCASSAIERLKKSSEKARCFAKLLEESPEFPRHFLCPNVQENQLLTMDEVSLALGLDLSIYVSESQRRTSRNQLLRRKGIERKDYQVTLKELNIILRNALPDGFPYIPFQTGEGEVKVKWSDALFAGFSNGLDSRKSTIFTELSIGTINTINEDLAPTKKKNRVTGSFLSGDLSLFQRWNYGDLTLTSHQLRHLLDTMASVNGMDGDLRAKWAMRSDPKHNSYYNHTPPDEYGADFIEDRENELASQKQIPTYQIQVQVATPRTIQELNTKASLTAHTTEFGMCISSYLSEPCTKYRDCINCDQQVCTKGDDDKCERIRKRLKLEKKLLLKDEKALKSGVQGAKQWYSRRKQTVEHCDQLLSMLEDPSIEDGALIRLDIKDVSQLDRAMEANGKKRLPDIINFKRIQNTTVNSLISSTPSELLDVDDSEDIYDDLEELDEISNIMGEE